jgi:FkbM family methyltransferase
MDYNRVLRRMAEILGVIGRRLGFSRIPLLKTLYLRVAQVVLPDHDVWVSVDGQSMLIPSPRRSVVSRMVYLFGVWEEPVTQILRKEIYPGMTALDIGAHIGYFTLILAKRVGKDGRVFSFEPNPEVQGYLRENVLHNGHSHVTICPMALFHEEGFGVMEERDFSNAWLARRCTDSTDAVPVAVYDRAAESLGIHRVDFVKMDVEGAELNILLGMRELLERDRPSLIIEIHPRGLERFGHSESEMRAYVESSGYAIRDVLHQAETTTVFCTRQAAAG